VRISEMPMVRDIIRAVVLSALNVLP